MYLNEYEFIKVVDLFKEIEEEVINENGELERITFKIPVKKKLEVPWQVRDLTKVHDFQPYYNDKGRFIKGYTSIMHDLYGPIVVKGDYQKLKQDLNKPENRIIHGFKQYKD